MRFLRSGIYFRFIVVMVSLAVIPAVLMGFLLMRISQEGIQASVLELQTKLAEKLAERVRSDLRSLDDSLRFSLNAVQKSSMGWTEKQDLLRSLIDSNGDIQEIAVVRSNGMELLKVYNPALTAAPMLVSRADDPGFKEFVRGKARTLWVTAHEGGPPSLDIYYPLNASLCLRVSSVLKQLWDSVGAERVGGTGFAMIVGEHGQPLMYPPGRLTPQLRATLPRWPFVQQALSARSVGSSEYKDGLGVDQVGAYAPVGSISGAVLIQQPRSEAYLAARKMRQTAMIVFVLFAAIAFTVAAFMARQLTRPMLVLTRAATEISEGSFPAPVVISTHDELGDLADTFNVMVAKLKSYAEMQIDRLLREQTKTEAILFSIGDGILMLDYDGRIQLANRRAKELLGIESHEGLEGRRLDEVVASPVQEALMQVAADPKENVFREIDLSTDQYRRILRISAQPVRVPEKGTSLGVVAAVRDVTVEKQLDKMKEEFLQSITHDLRNPVGSAIGFAEFLLKGVVGTLNDQQKSMVESIRKACTRLLAMVNNILDLAKLEAGRMELKLKEVSVAEVAARAIGLLGSLAQRRGLKVALEAPSEFKLEADGDLLERVITNLAGNAIKFAAEDGQVKVTVSDEPEHVKVCVADDGEGVPPEHLERIFEKFEQVPGQRKGGTGLGLTICRHIVEAHLGQIWAESEPGKGARFLFRIPKDLVYATGGKVARKQPASAADDPALKAGASCDLAEHGREAAS
ncbi:MAG: ATP-binding protein [Elusimicrobia bacterium]|nr:ATP-binding protein [Elusimicrobiota bacterium]